MPKFCVHCGAEIKKYDTCCVLFAQWGQVKPRKFGPGTLAYWNSMSGMIKCKVKEIQLTQRAVGTAKVMVTTSANKTYDRGEIVFVNLRDIFPQEVYHQTGIFTFRTDPYEWIGVEQ